MEHIFEPISAPPPYPHIRQYQYHVFVNPQVAVDPPSGHDKALAERHEGFQPRRVRHLRVQGLLELQEGRGLGCVKHQDKRPALVSSAGGWAAVCGGEFRVFRGSLDCLIPLTGEQTVSVHADVRCGWTDCGVRSALVEFIKMQECLFSTTQQSDVSLLDPIPLPSKSN